MERPPSPWVTSPSATLNADRLLVLAELMDERAR